MLSQWYTSLKMLTDLANTSTAVVSSVTLLLILVYLLTTVARYTRYKLPPGPTPWPLIGNAYNIIWQKNLHEYFVKLTKKYGPIFSIKIGNVPHVVINNCDLAQELYMKKMRQFVDRPVQLFIAILSEGGRDLFTQNFSQILKMHRKIVTQAIRGHLHVGDNIETTTHEQCRQSFDYLRKMAKNKELFTARYVVLNTVYKLYFKLMIDLDFDFNDEKLWYMCTRSKELSRLMGIGFLADLAPSLFRWLPEYGDMKKASDCHEVFKDFIREKVQEMDRALDDNAELKGPTAAMLRAKREAAKEGRDSDFTEEDVVLNVVEFFLAGADGIANILEWTFLELANHPDKQEKMYAEIQEVLGDRPVSLKDKPTMIYSECATLEGLRTGLSAPINFRGSTVADTELGGYDIPKNTPILINHHALHKDADFWGQDVNEYRPERFIGGDGKLIPKPKNLIPFGAGARSCVGEQLTKDHLFLLAVSFVQKFKLCRPPGVEKIKSEYRGGFVAINTVFEMVAEERK